MAGPSSIEWTDATWNPVTGCTKVSPGCKFCYAERMAGRLKAMGAARYRNGFEVQLQPAALETPLRWRKPRLVFVNSMSDLFHESVPLEFIQRVFDVMNEAGQHQFQVLTKRSERLAAVARELNWGPNIWMGVSVEGPKYYSRIEHLVSAPAAVRFLSVEPMLEACPSLPLTGVHWVIVGGESGPGARPMEEEWVVDVRDQCIGAGVPFFFKQWGGVQKKKKGRVLEGATYSEFPEFGTK